MNNIRWVMYNSVVHACIESTYVRILNVNLLQEYLKVIKMSLK